MVGIHICIYVGCNKRSFQRFVFAEIKKKIAAYVFRIKYPFPKPLLLTKIYVT